MGYQVGHRNSFSKDLKDFKKNKPVTEEIKSLVLDIVANPTIGDALLGNWEGFSKYSFSKKPELRIIYIVKECCKAHEEKCPNHEDGIPGCEGLVVFHFIKTREECNNLYSKDKKYIDNLR